MTDQHAELRDILAELRAALDATDDLDDQARAHLCSAAEQIDEVLDPNSATDSAPSLGDWLAEAVDRFEGAHPRLTAVVGRLSAALSDLGI